MRLIFIRQKLTNNYVMMFHSDDEGAPLKLDHSAEGTRRLDRVPVSVSEWLLGSFVLISICPTQPIFTNTESAMLSIQVRT